MVDITIVNGVYKPTYNWGAQPCRNDGFSWIFQHAMFDDRRVVFPIHGMAKCGFNGQRKMGM